MLVVGQTVEPFALTAHDGTEVRWQALRGAPVVVFCYPKANTPGCTTEACAFRDLAPEFEGRGVHVLGLSADPVKKQLSFAKKYELTMPLLADPDRLVLGPWGAWGEKKLYGKVYEGVIRCTFLFDAAGAVHRAWPKVTVAGHADDVLTAVDELLGR
jgi:thioredoxin-dependent peroxiredoxin